VNAPLNALLNALLNAPHTTNHVVVIVPRKIRASIKASATSNTPSILLDKKRAISKHKAKDDALVALALKYYKARLKSIIDNSNANNELASSDASSDASNNNT
jgi:hypothetical protein